MSPEPNLGRPLRSSGRAGSSPDAAANLDADEVFFHRLGEFLRRVALGGLALLVVARAYYPSEDSETGTGLVWILCLLGVAALAVAANLVAGMTRLRWSWADPAVFALIVLVGWSAGHAADRRPAITQAWEWGGLGLLYLLARNLPRSRGESATLAGVLVATAVAVATYGLYQVPVEFAQLRQQFTRNPAAMMARLGIVAGTPTAESFQKRLMDSNEPFSTFALANSLAGFLVGPLVLLLAVGLENLKRDGKEGKGLSFALATLPGLILLICLILTKSRSAYAGLGVALLVLAWSYRNLVPRRWLIGAGGGLAVVVLGLIGAGVASRQLDIQILTEARKSLGYRWEYWVGSWGIITDAPPPFAANAGSNALLGGGSVEPTPRSSRAFWWGVGPANFAGPYRRHKLPEASEEIQDPHNMILEVWAESGFFAMTALLASLGLGLAQILAPTRADRSVALPDGATKPAAPASRDGWLVVMGGLGWFGVWVLGQLNPVTQSDMLMRWLVLGLAWGLGVVLIGPIWARRPIPAVGLGVAVLALAVHLLAAGGIGIPSVAMVLWVLIALGLNLRDDRSCGRLRTSSGLGLAVGLACGWAVLAGTFYGAVMPGWLAEAAVLDGEAAMAARPPRYEIARADFEEAITLDHYSIRPWLALADLEYRFWRSPESGNKLKTGWTKVLLIFDKALEGSYRDPNNLFLRQLQADYARKILSELPDDAKPFELLDLKATIVKATRNEVRLYPTSANLRGDLAQASADLGTYDDAAREAKAALQLDALTPHLDKKLSAPRRAYLTSKAIEWEQQAKAAVPAPLPK